MKKKIVILVMTTFIIGAFAIFAQNYKCNMCQDTKTITTFKTCPTCNGTKAMNCQKKRVITCISCKGAGTVEINRKKVTCNYCKGTGKMEEAYTDKCSCTYCTNGRVSSIETCPSCK